MENKHLSKDDFEARDFGDHVKLVQRFVDCLEVGAPLMRAGRGGVPRKLPLSMEGVKLLKDGPLAKAAFFC